VTPTGPMVWEIHHHAGWWPAVVACRVLVKGNEAMRPSGCTASLADGGCGHYGSEALP
jgi:hypothetical protein